MTLPRRSIRQIEGRELASSVNLASSYRDALRILREHEAAQELRELVSSSPLAATAAAARVLRLVDRETDIRYEHPYDVALLAYLWALERVSTSLASAVAHHAVHVAANLWWTRAFAERLANRQPQRSEETGTTTSSDAEGSIVEASTGSGERALIGVTPSAGDALLWEEGLVIITSMTAPATLPVGLEAAPRPILTPQASSSRPGALEAA